MRSTPGKTDRADDDKRRLYIFSAAPILSFLIFIIVLFSLQIIKGPAYELRAKTNREQFSILPSIRGIIYDRSGEVILAYNRKSFAVSIVPQNFPRIKEEKDIILGKLAILLEMDKDEILQIMEGKAYSRYGSYVLKTDVPFKDIVFLAEHNRDFPGVYWKSKPVRVYPYNDMLSHVLGYVGMISENELLELADIGYNLESVIGKSGIEKIYDIELKGKDGFVRRIVDATNQVSAEIIDKGAGPVPGNYVVLTIDKDIQAMAEKALDKRIGTVVVSKPSTGEILALVSYPRYDPNLFISLRDKDFFKNLTLDKRKPFLNRAIQAQYPAGSIFKLVVALGILDSGKVPPKKEFVCGGGYRVGDRFFSDWADHGIVDLYKAIVVSCDSYFYQTSLVLGPEAIYQYAKELGFGNKLGIDLVGELDGTVPNPEWKREVKGDIWYDGDTLNLAIGQGYLLVTPLQVNALTNLIANRGVLMKPHLVSEIYSAKSDEILYRRSSDILVNSNIGKEDFEFIANAMRGVVTDGTAKWGGAVFSAEVAGKTSTAEVAGRETHSWYTAFAPYITDDPDEIISVTTIVEHGGAGSVNAAPIVSEIIEAIFADVSLETARKNIWKKRTEVSARGASREIEEPADL